MGSVFESVSCAAGQKPQVVVATTSRKTLLGVERAWVRLAHPFPGAHSGRRRHSVGRMAAGSVLVNAQNLASELRGRQCYTGVGEWPRVTYPDTDPRSGPS